MSINGKESIPKKFTTRSEVLGLYNTKLKYNVINDKANIKLLCLV